jgi:hypothetical protein
MRMSRSRTLIGIVVGSLAALLAGGPTSAFAASHRSVVSTSYEAPSGCSGTISPYQEHTWFLNFKCSSGSFSSFKVKMDYPAYGGGAANVVIKGKSHHFSCKLSASTSSTCSGVTVPAATTVHFNVDSHDPLCTSKPRGSATVTIDGKHFQPSATC